MAELNRPPNILQPYRKGLDWNPARVSEIAAALDRGNTGIAPPVAILPRLELCKQLVDGYEVATIGYLGNSYQNPQLLWGDGSQTTPGGSGTYTWPDATTGHAAPQNAALIFGYTADCFFDWGVNLFPVFQSGSIGGGGYDQTMRMVLDLLDADSNILTTATWNSYISTDIDSNYTVTQALTFDAKKINSFNAMRATAIVSGSWPSEYYWNASAALYFFLQNSARVG